jgi:hypothetical protein
LKRKAGVTFVLKSQGVTVGASPTLVSVGRIVVLGKYTLFNNIWNVTTIELMNIVFE